MIVFFFSFEILFISMNPTTESNKFRLKEKVLRYKITFRSKKNIRSNKKRSNIEFFLILN